jgi:hypothetical protein
MRKRLVIGELTPKLACAIHGRVDGAPKQGFERTHRFHHLAEGDVADNHQIDVAGRHRCTRSNRPVDESTVDPIGQRCERRAQLRRDSRGLVHETLQLREARVGRVRSIENQVGMGLLLDHPGA